MCFSQRIVQGQRLQSRGFGFGHELLLRRCIPGTHQSKSVRQARVSARIAWVLRDGLLEITRSLPEAGAGPLIPEVPALEIEIVGFIGSCGVGWAWMTRGFRPIDVTKADLNLIADLLGYFALQRQGVVQFAVILPCPKVRLVFYLDEFCGDACPA